METVITGGSRLAAEEPAARNGLCRFGDKFVAPFDTAMRLATLPNATIYH